jgi:hypothetical protein
MKWFLTSSIFMLIQTAVFANGNPGKTQAIVGTVVDGISGEQLTGVRVLLLGSTEAVYSDEQGRFELNCPVGEVPTIIFELVSFQQMKVSIADIQHPLEVTMVEIP